MLSLLECKKILGVKFEKCTDEQIKQIRSWLYKIAELEIEGITKDQNFTKNETSSSIYKSKYGRAS